MAGMKLLDVIEETDPLMIKLVFTGYHTPESEKMSKERGADGYITKPVSIEDLLTRIDELLFKKEEETNNREEKI